MISSENELFVPMRCRRLLERRLSHPALLHSIKACIGRFVQTTGRLPFGVLTFNHLLLIEVSPQWINTLFILVAINCFFSKKEVVISIYWPILFTFDDTSISHGWNRLGSDFNKPLIGTRKERTPTWLGIKCNSSFLGLHDYFIFGTHLQQFWYSLALLPDKSAFKSRHLKACIVSICVFDYTKA